VSEANEGGGEAQAEPIEETPAPASDLDAIREDRDRIRDQLLRIAADFDNFRKRSKRDVEEAERRSKEKVIVEMLPLVDNLERAVQSAATATNAAAVAEGVEMVLRSFGDIAERIGIVRVPSIGERFDPALHDAVQQVETDAHPPGTVLAEVVPGYRLGDKLVRAALVVVAKPPAVPPPAEG
jgi:molecular chaperone GrpE